MKRAFMTGSVAIVLVASMLCAQQPPTAEPQKEHEWLKHFVGEWQTESEAVAQPGQPAFKCSGMIKSRMLGDLWVISELETEMMGVRVNAVQTIGYDTKSKKYIGTWVDSMMNYMWKYEGTVDESGKILTLEAEGPSFTDPEKQSKYRDVYEFKSKDHLVISSAAQGEDGSWTTFMTGHANRKK